MSYGDYFAEVRDDGDGLGHLEKLYTRATSRTPHTDRTLFVKAVLAQQNRRFDKAAECIAAAICYTPDNPHYQYLLGEVCGEAGWIREGILALNRTIYLDPRDEHAWYDLGMLFARQKMLIQAETCFHQCLAIDPDMDEARSALVTLRNRPQT